MKMKFKVLIAVMMIACFSVMILGGCSKSIVGNTELAEELTRSFLDNVFAKKYEDAYALIDEACSREEFKALTDYMESELDGVSSYELKVISWNSTLNNNVTKTTVGFEMKADNGKKYEVSTVLISDVDGIAGFHIKPVPKIVDTVSMFKIPLIIISVAVVAFQIWMVVDCIRNKTKLKILWIIIILLSIRLSLMLGASELNFMPSIFLGLSLSGVVVTGTTFSVQVTMPIGAIIYLAARKKLHTPVAPPPAPEQIYNGYMEQPTTPPEQQPETENKDEQP